MAETLGSLCDKLTTVKLKQWHTDDPERLASLATQEKQLTTEIDDFVAAAIEGHVPLEKLTFAANKVYKKDGNTVREFGGSLGHVLSQLAATNCHLWHVQERVYDFETVPAAEKDAVIKELAVVNLERNRCIDRVDEEFRRSVEAIRTQRRPASAPGNQDS